MLRTLHWEAGALRKLSLCFDQANSGLQAQSQLVKDFAGSRSKDPLKNALQSRSPRLMASLRLLPFASNEKSKIERWKICARFPSYVRLRPSGVDTPGRSDLSTTLYKGSADAC